MIEAVRANGCVAAATLITRLIEAADTFVAGAPQHDDMTSIVVRVL